MWVFSGAPSLSLSLSLPQAVLILSRVPHISILRCGVPQTSRIPTAAPTLQRSQAHPGYHPEPHQSNPPPPPIPKRNPPPLPAPPKPGAPHLDSEMWVSTNIPHPHSRSHPPAKPKLQHNIENHTKVIPHPDASQNRTSEPRPSLSALKAVPAAFNPARRLHQASAHPNPVTANSRHRATPHPPLRGYPHTPPSITMEATSAQGDFVCPPG
jgi:hypothetical protein